MALLRRFSPTRGLLSLTLVYLPRAALFVLCLVPTAAHSLEGFGSETPGGGDGAVVRVTNLNDSGPGSLRDAVSQGDRTVVFDVAGEIQLFSHVYVSGAFVTIDGTSAPAPGITLKGHGLYIRGTHGAHDVIVREIRVRDSAEDGIQIAWSAFNIVIDRVSIHNSADGNLDITENSHDVTVSRSIFAKPGGTQKNMLIKYNPSRISLHHNLFVKSSQRNPQVRIDDAGTPASDTTLDMRNNLVWDWGGGSGTLIWYGPRVNLVNNYYAANGGDKSDTLIACTGGGQSECLGGYPASYAWTYVDGNMSADGISLGNFGNLENPEPAPFVATLEACTAAHQVLANAGVRPPDSVDQGYLSAVNLPACLGVTPGRLDFTGIAGGVSPLSKTVSISGLGGTEYVWTASVVAGSWLSLSSPAGATPSNISVLASPSGLPVGSYAGSIEIAAGGAPNSPIMVPVTLVVKETDPDSNSRSLPDLFVMSTSLSVPATAVAGTTISVTDGTKNQGEGAADPSVTKFYLSADSVLDSADILLGGREVPSLGSREKSTASTLLTIPTGVPAGNYFLIAVADADQAVPETVETNNDRYAAIALLGLPPDLFVISYSLTAPARAKRGSMITVTDSTKNQGEGLAGASTTKFYLSSDHVVDSRDILLGGRPVPALASREKSDGSTSLTIPRNIPKRIYYLIAAADADEAVNETDEANNIRYLTIDIR